MNRLYAVSEINPAEKMISWRMKTKPLVSFIGMDGAGKTTLTNMLLRILTKNNIKAERIYTGRGRDNLLPIRFIGAGYEKIKSMKKNRKNGNLSVVGNKKKCKKEYNRFSIIHSISAPVFAADLLLRYAFRIAPARKRNDIVITDRYSTDILLMDGVPGWLRFLLFSLMPKPDIVFYVYNDINVLHKRKPSHPLEDLKRQEKIFAIINKRINPVMIKNDKLEKSIELILKVLSDEDKKAI